MKHKDMIAHKLHSGTRLLLLASAGFILAATSLSFGNELLLNYSFDQGSNNWRVASAIAVNPFSTVGQASLNVPDYTGNVLSQDLDMVGVSNAAVRASLTLTRIDTVSGSAVTAHLLYADYAGITNRVLLLNPENSSITNNTEISANLTLPTNARRLVRFEVDKAASGNFDLLAASLDVTPSGPAPYVYQDRPMDGDVFATGTNIYMVAQASALELSVSQVSFRANGKQIGIGDRHKLYGEWTFPTGEHMSIMPGPTEMIDLSFPDYSFYVMDGSFPSSNQFVGMFTTWLDSGMAEGSATVEFSFTPAGLLNALFQGDAPLGNRALSNGATEAGFAYYTFMWTNVPAGLYGVTVVATYGTGETVSGSPLNLEVAGGGDVEKPSVQAGLVSPGQIKLSWVGASADFRPKYTTDLGNGQWQPVSGTPQLVDGSWTLTVDVGSTPVFFRLEK